MLQQSRVLLAVFHRDPQHSDKCLDELWMKNRSGYCSEDIKRNIFWSRALGISQETKLSNREP
ncbi:MAG: hypothetical protein V1753_08840 [Pseudomonadota bacterium]